MADWYPSFYAEIKALVLATWPEISSAQYFTSLQFLRDNLTQEQNRAEKGESGRVQAPYAVLSVGRLSPEEGYGLGSRLKRADVRVWYIDRVQDRGSVDNQTFVHGKVAALAQAIDIPGFSGTYFEPEGLAEVDSSENNEINNTFMESKLSFIGAVVTWPSGWIVGEVGAP